MTADLKLENYSKELPKAPEPKGVYKPILIVDNLVYVSGHGPDRVDGTQFVGKVGEDVDKEFGKLAARQVGLTILSTLKKNLGTLNRVKRVVKVLGMVNAHPDFDLHPYVINGCSELFAEIWGTEHGIGVRSAVGMGSLPGRITVEIEAVFELI
ncbi:MAG: RidA family protein [Cytophagaceae bacterium]|nr:RidA family protein [Cytophagaceae bacterium]MBK9510275.1 RidA family protein [Cytophagaceae bacterium]MBK9933153.1 RidA family protein [Cytophagaceae bacterium]MBL0303130.1 RidA family protein [Cytophagaceae bacterium]MBL0325977.1 RidA family protein [Cytophagaceae bacterium]